MQQSSLWARYLGGFWLLLGAVLLSLNNAFWLAIPLAIFAIVVFGSIVKKELGW
jgi:hypothetical protein